MAGKSDRVTKRSDWIYVIGLPLIFSFLFMLIIICIVLISSLDTSSSTYSSDYASLLGTIGTVILAAITVAALVANDKVTRDNLKLNTKNLDLNAKNLELNSKNIELNARMFELQTQPRVAVEVAPSMAPKGVNMIVRNSGNGIARNVRFLDFADIQVMKGRSLADIDFIKNGIPYMPPNQSYQAFAALLKPEDEPMGELRFTLNYEDLAGVKYEQKIQISMESFRAFFIPPRIRDIG